ncbi:hypothetical protein [Bradyrhizobium sp. USDA 4350]
MAAIDPNAIAQARAAGYSDKEIADHLANTDGVKQAREHGYSDKEIIAHIVGDKAPAPEAPEASGAMAALGHGTEDIANGVKETAKNYLGVGPGADKPDPNYVPANVTNGTWNPLKWNYSQIPQKAAEMAPGLAETMVAAKAGAKAGQAIGGGKGAIVGGILGPAAAMWANSAGNAAKEDAIRRTGDANATPNASDLTRAGLSEGASSLVQAAAPAAMVLGPAAKAVGVAGLKQAAGKYLGNTALAGASGAGADAVSQFGNTIGTDQGYHPDWGRTADAGIGNAVAAGVIGAPRGAAEAYNAARQSVFGGANAQAAAAYFNRVQANAGAKGLGDATRDLNAHDNTVAGLKKELQAVDDTGLPQDTANTLALARTGKPLTVDHVKSIEAADPQAGFLARQMYVAQQAEKFGSLDRQSGKWAGGVSGLADKYAVNTIKRHAALSGAAALGGVTLHGSYALPTLAGATGVYWGARGVDNLTGMRSPLKGLATKFADTNVPTRLAPPSNQPPPQPLQQAPQGPWGPKPLAQQSVPQVQPQAPAAPQPQISPVALKMALANAKATTKQMTAPPPAAVPAAPVAAPISPVALKMALANAKATTKELNAPPEEPPAPAPVAPEAPPISPVALKMALANAKATTKTMNTPTEEVAAPAAPEAPQINPVALKMALANAKATTKDMTAPPPAPPAPPVPAPAPPQVNPLRLPTDITAPARNLMNGLSTAQARNPTGVMPIVPPKVAATALKTKITKTEGQAQPEVKTEAPAAAPAAASRFAPWDQIGEYTPIPEAAMRFKGKAPNQIAQMIAGDYADLPQLRKQSLINNVVATHTARDNAIAALMKEMPHRADILQMLNDQLHEPGNADPNFSRRAIKHHAGLLSADEGAKVRAHYDKPEVKDAIWPPKSKRKKSTKKDEIKVDAAAS